MDNATKSLFIKLGIMALTAIAGYLHVNVPDQQLAAFSTDAIDLALLAYGYYRSHGTKLVPKASVAIDASHVALAYAPVPGNVVKVVSNPEGLNDKTNTAMVKVVG